MWLVHTSYYMSTVFYPWHEARGSAVTLARLFQGPRIGSLIVQHSTSYVTEPGHKARGELNVQAWSLPGLVARGHSDSCKRPLARAEARGMLRSAGSHRYCSWLRFRHALCLTARAEARGSIRDQTRGSIRAYGIRAC